MRGNIVSLVVTYKPKFKNLSYLICEKLQFLYEDPDTKRVFTPVSLTFKYVDKSISYP